MFKRPKKRLTRLPEEGGPWVIWSHKWGAFHRRSSSGGASGYTDDIANAGIFEYETASGYHDTDLLPLKEIRNEAFPLSQVIGLMRERLDQMTAERDALSAKIERVSAALIRNG